jgi:hypothetical protein
MDSEPLFSLNGGEPDVVGLRCTGFALVHFHEGQRITDLVNVAYLRFDEQWYRLYFEASTVFWRKTEAPEAAQNSGLAHGLLLNDLSGMDSVVGQTVQTVTYAGSRSGGVRTSISFLNGNCLEFAHDSEVGATRLVASRSVS